MEENITNAKPQDEEEVFSMKDFLAQCLDQWKWFLISVIIFCCLGAIFILRQQPVFSRSMAVLIKDQDGGGGMSEISSAFSSLGFGGGNTNVNNELISLTSPAVMSEVIKRLGLQYNYDAKGVFHPTTLYGKSAPFNVLMADLGEQDGAGFEMDWNPDGTIRLYNFYKYDPKKIKLDGEVSGRVDGKVLRTPIGRVVVSPNTEYVKPKKGEEALEVKVSHSGLQSAIEAYSAKVKGDLADKDAEVIDLTMRDVSVQRAVDVLDNIVEVYNEEWAKDKNKVAVATSRFIDDRLMIIEQELGTVDNEIAQYKSDQRILDIHENAKQGVVQSAELSSQMLDVTNQLSMASYVKDYISNPVNVNNVIPVNTGMGSVQLENQIANYNTMLLNRNTLAQNSSDSNPLVLDYDAQLRGLREAIVRAIGTQVATLQKTLNNMQGAKGAVDHQLAANPTQARYLLGVGRQQKVKESLYLYLLQKREENELSQSNTIYNTRVITPPMGPIKPVAPRVFLTMAVALMLGLCVPGIWIYIQEITNTTVRGRKDLDKLSTPFAGEIPYVSDGKRHNIFTWIAGLFKKKRKPRPGELETVLRAVKEGSRDAISESFKIVRGNIDLMVDKDQASHIIMLTSFNAGSGKSFIIYNLAASFAMKGKKVLVIDGDLRHGSASQFVGMPSKGLTNYLTGATDDWRSLIVADQYHKGMYVFPIGHRPPNPSELLDGDRFGILLKELRSEYDYILIDCPPVDVVVDTQIIEKYVDRTLFVVRAGLLHRKAVVEIDELYKSKRFKQMSIILNGTDHKSKRYGSYGSYGSYGNYGSYGYYGAENK